MKGSISLKTRGDIRTWGILHLTKGFYLIGIKVTPSHIRSLLEVFSKYAVWPLKIEGSGSEGA